MSTDVTIQVEPSGPYISSLASYVNDARDFRDAAQSALGAVTAAAADMAANKTATDAARLATEAASTAAAASAASALGAKDNAASAAVAAASVVLTHDRYRNQLDDWRALLVPERPSLFQRFTDSTYFARDRVVTSDFPVFLAATNGAFTRASGATALDSAGKLIEFAAGSPRVTDRGLLMEGGGTNLIRNPRCEGAAAGSPGTLPTYMSGSATSNGISRQVVGTGVENGVPYVDVRYAGTSVSAGRIILIIFAASGSIAAAAGETFTASFYSRIVAGSVANLSYIRLEVLGSSADGSETETPAGANIVDGGITKTTVTHAIASLAYVVPRLAISTGSGIAVDFTVRIGAPQLEKYPFATSPILPPVGSPAQATRVGDRVVSTRTSPAALSKAIRGRPAPTNTTQVLWQADDGTSNNMIRVRRNGVGDVYATAVIASVTVLDVRIGAVADNAEFRLAFRWAANDFTASLNGATVVTNTAAAMPAGLVNERLGHATGGNEWFGTIRDNHEWPILHTNGNLQTLSTL